MIPPLVQPPPLPAGAPQPSPLKAWEFWFLFGLSIVTMALLIAVARGA